MFEELPENAAPPRPPLAPPPGPVTGVRSILWNERELRAGWRLALFVLFCFLFLMLASGVLLLLRVPMSMRVSLTPGTMIAIEGTELGAALAAAAIMSLAEGRPFGVYG